MPGRLALLLLLARPLLLAALGPCVAEVRPVRVDGRDGRPGAAERRIYRLRAFGTGFTLHLVPDSRFVAPGFSVRRLGESGERAEPALRRCFYSGGLQGRRESRAAVSLCRGMRGAFSAGAHHYLIEPRGPGDSLSRPHLLRRRGCPPGGAGSPPGTGSLSGGAGSPAGTGTPPGDADGPPGAGAHTPGGTGAHTPGAAPPGTGTLPGAHTPGGTGAHTPGAAPPGTGTLPGAHTPGGTGAHIPGAAPPGTGTLPGAALTPGTGTGTGAAARARRFVSEARYMETLLVADASMARLHGDELPHYLLTLMAVVAGLYRDPSVRNLLHVVVVRLLVAGDGDGTGTGGGPQVSTNAGLTLRRFCAWQRRFNPPSDRHPEHFDTALLFTRQDICGHKSCDTLGVADTGTMCDPSRSCAVIEDNGLQAAYTTAHELGHELSMPHDDSKACEKLFGQMKLNHVMAPLFIRLNSTLPWSPCSAFHVTEFFDNGHGDCLLDAPVQSLSLPTKLPGQVYDLDAQCQQIFGEEYRHCPNTSDSDVCSQLWCRIEDKPECHTKNGSLLWADGTPCGKGTICVDGVCLATEIINGKTPIQGSWGSWSPWGECSRSCGGGVQFSFRECNDPVPQNSGKYCEGQRTRYRSCNTQDCPSNNGKSFREEQCEKYNSWNYKDLIGNAVKWIPKYSGVSPRDRCKLFCRVRGRSEFKVFEPKVIDGTPCGPETTSVCVHGQCVKAGCDHVIGSSKKFDKCAVCGGNSSTCRKITGSLNKSKYGYNNIVTIPAGATNIDVKQRSHKGIKHDGNYLAVKLLDDTYVLNGDYSVITVEQYIPLGGAVLKYSGSSTTLERIQSFKQLQEPLTIQLLSISTDTLPPRVKYSFFIPNDVSLSKQKAKSTKKSPNAFKQAIVSQYTLGEWSECSRSCGSGWQRRNVECKDNDGNLSLDCNKALKPEDIRPCADVPCPLWQLGPWSSCSRTCGKGERKRSVLCMEYTGKTAEEDKCDPSKQPKPMTEECFQQEC